VFTIASGNTKLGLAVVREFGLVLIPKYFLQEVTLNNPIITDDINITFFIFIFQKD